MDHIWDPDTIFYHPCSPRNSHQGRMIRDIELNPCCSLLFMTLNFLLRLTKMSINTQSLSTSTRDYDIKSTLDQSTDRLSKRRTSTTTTTIKDPLLQAILRLGGVCNDRSQISIRDDHTVDSTGRIFAHTMLPSRHCDLQKCYTTTKVVYAPDPYILLETSKKIDRSNVFLLMYRSTSNMTHVDRLVSHVSKKYDSLEKCMFTGIGERTVKDLCLTITKLRKVSFIMIVDCDRETAGLIVGSGTPFCMINPDYGNYSDCIDRLNLSALIIKSQDYNDLKVCYKSVCGVVTDVISNHVSNLTHVRRTAGWTRLCIERGCNQGATTTLSPRKSPQINYYCQALEHSDCPFISELLVDLTSHSSTMGVCLDIAVYRSYVTHKYIRRYPWVGLVEIGDIDSIERLLKSPEFMASLCFCQGIYTTCCGRRALQRLRDDLVSHGITVATIDPPLPIGVQFYSHEAFTKTPRLVSYAATVTKIATVIPTSIFTGNEGNSINDDNDSTSSDSDDSTNDESSGDGQSDTENEIDNDIARLMPTGETPNIPVNHDDNEDTLADLINGDNFSLGSDEDDSDSSDNSNDSNDDDTGSTSESTSDSSDDLSNGDVLGTSCEIKTLQRENTRDIAQMSCSAIILEDIPYSSVGVITSCIARTTPVILRRSPEAESLLGSNYILYNDILDPDSVAQSFTNAEIASASRHIDKLRGACSVPDFLTRLSRSQTGKKIAMITAC